MRASTPTKLSLYEWCRIIGIQPLHFGGVDIPELDASHPHCTQPWVQYEWQAGDRVGREAVARAIAQAEEDMERFLHFRILPTFEIQERKVATPTYDPDIRWPSRRYRTRWGYLLGPGGPATEDLTIVQQLDGITLVDILWSDDSYWQKGTVLLAITAGTDLETIHLYYPDHRGEPEWEIRPVTITLLNSTTASVSFRRECAVIPDLFDALEAVAAVGTDDADFLTTVEAQRTYQDPSTAVAFRWQPSGCWCNGQGTCEPCSNAATTGCFSIDDAQLGLVATRPGTWDAGTFTGTHWPFHQGKPDGADLTYRAGWEDQTRRMPTREMDGQIARAVAFYAAALLDRPPCDCSFYAWQKWRTIRGEGQTFSRGFAPGSIGNDSVFGPWEGALYAWRVVERLSLGEGAG